MSNSNENARELLKEKNASRQEAEEKIKKLEKIIENTGIFSFDPECVRKKSNWSKPANEFRFDHSDFEVNMLLDKIPHFSPKLKTLLDKIRDLDKADQKKHGKLFKHFIFSDLKFGAYGAKLIASALIADDYNLGYRAEPIRRDNDREYKKNYEKIELLPDATLKKTAQNNFYMLSSVSVYDQSISVKTKKEMLQKFNQRPENAHGDLVRFIVLDSGFKEGIDLFDVKYVHIFEPSTVLADQKQVIGRATRTCGQKGIAFHPIRGWPLDVFIYDLSIPEKIQGSLLNSKNAMELFLKSMNLDMRLMTFTHDLEKTTVIGSVDYDLNKNVHSFSIPALEHDEEDVEQMYGGGGKKNKVKDLAFYPEELAIVPVQPAKRLDHGEMKYFIKENFSEFSWESVKMENLCEDKPTGGSGVLIKYTPTQDFIRHYFHPWNPVKGMLLYHSVGTGKTCSAIATATTNFEKNGYTILWVTRTTLKNDIWKNMFDQVCNESIRTRIENQNLEIPKDNSRRLRLLSKAWQIRPMSYKQFSNLILKRNSLYDNLVKINGKEDPLRKTLLIIDEAHKLYGGEDLSSLEKPDMNALKKALMYSYQYSGQDSVRLLLMTATPITNNPMELIQLVNLCKPSNEQMPEDFSLFSEKYLQETGEFTDKGRKEYLDDISGYVSYLNREKDARQFAQPQIQHVYTPITPDIKQVERFDKKIMRDLDDSSKINELKTELINENKKLEGELGQISKAKFTFLNEDTCGDLTGSDKSKCNQIVNRNIRELIKEAKEYAAKIKTRVKEINTLIREGKKTRTEMMKKVRENTKIAEDEYAIYKESLLYNLKDTCSKKIMSGENLQNELKNHPGMQKFEAEIDIQEQKIKALEDDLKILKENYKIRVKSLKHMLRTDLSELERRVIESVIRDERTEHIKLFRLKKRETQRAAKIIKEGIQKLEKNKTQKRNAITKNIRNTIKEEQRRVKNLDRETKKIRKTIMSPTKIMEDETLKNLVNKYQSKIMSDLVSFDEEKMEKEAQKKAEKEQKKKEQDAVKREAKEKKQQEMQKKKEEIKAAKALEKEKARETKRQAQEEKKQNKKKSPKTRKKRSPKNK